MNTKRFLALGLLSLAFGMQTVNSAAKVETKKSDSVFTFKSEEHDLKGSFTGALKSGYSFDKNNTLYNSQVPDQISAFSNRLDLNTNVVFGEKQYGSPATEFVSSFRLKFKAGENGKSSAAAPAIRHLWATMYLNTLLGLTSDLQHSVRIGAFPYSVGRGIALGNFVGQSKSFLGLFSDSHSRAPWGVLLNGEIIKDSLSYDVYFARLEENSSSFATVSDINTVKTHTDYRYFGVANNNDLAAVRLMHKYAHDKMGKLDSEFYLVYNNASAQTVFEDKDATTTLFTAGSAFEWNNSGWEAGTEVALNFGRETIYKSASNANEFTVDFEGWTAVADASYEFANYDTKVAFGVGHASGDANPHTAKKDAKYKGFIGLHEGYAGNRVKSVMMLDARKALRPISVNETSSIASDDDRSFSDITHFGAGVSYKWSKKWSVSSNLLAYFKDHTSKGYTYAVGGTDAVSADDARKYYGSEINVIVEHEVSKGLKFGVNTAVFIPGSYYTDIKGLPYDADKTASPGNNRTGSLIRRVGDDIAYHLNLGFEYKF